MEDDNEVKVLIVDDDEWICYYLSRFVSRNGYRALTATSGNQAVDLASKHHPQIILLDIVMPDIDGLETIRRLRKADEQGVVIIITGHSDARTAREAMQLGAFEYISKPFSLNALKNALRNGLREYSAEKPHLSGECVIEKPTDQEIRTVLSETGTMRVELIESPIKTAVPRRRQRVLLMVDAGLAEIMTRELSIRGYEILATTDYERATQILLRKESRPEVVLIDVTLPNVRGGQFCRFIKTNSLFSGVQVILYGELTADGLLPFVREFGADACVSKQELFRTWLLPNPACSPREHVA